MDSVPDRTLNKGSVHMPWYWLRKSSYTLRKSTYFVERQRNIQIHTLVFLSTISLSVPFPPCKHQFNLIQDTPRETKSKMKYKYAAHASAWIQNEIHKETQWTLFIRRRETQGKTDSERLREGRRSYFIYVFVFHLPISIVSIHIEISCHSTSNLNNLSARVSRREYDVEQSKREKTTNRHFIPRTTREEKRQRKLYEFTAQW